MKQIIQGVINKRSIAKLRIEIAAYDDAIYYNNNAGAEARAFKHRQNLETSYMSVL